MKVYKWRERQTKDKEKGWEWSIHWWLRLSIAPLHTPPKFVCVCVVPLPFHRPTLTHCSALLPGGVASRKLVTFCNPFISSSSYLVYALVSFFFLLSYCIPWRIRNKQTCSINASRWVRIYTVLYCTALLHVGAFLCSADLCPNPRWSRQSIHIALTHSLTSHDISESPFFLFLLSIYYWTLP